jgi:TolA-binding protein
MRYIACFTVVVVLLSLLGATTYSQAGGSGGSGGSFSGGGGTGADPQQMHADFQRRMAEHQRDFQQRMDEMQRRAQESRSQNIRDLLRATDEQWQQLKPKLDRIERLKGEANVALEPGSVGSTSGFQGRGRAFGGGSMSGGGWAGGFGSGGMGPGQSQFRTWSWGSPSGSKSPMEMTPGEVLCDELQRLLTSPSASAAEITQKIQALRRIRTKAGEDLAAARKELRASISQSQEAPLVLMGYFD